jgi:two-component system C4-dicarboxylate transport response regulator DctD
VSRLLNGLVIAVAEDDDLIRPALEQLLKMAGADVTAFDDGRPLLAAMHQGFRPHLIMTDLAMKDLHGLELIEKLKADIHTWGIPIVVLTAAADEGMRELAMSKGTLFYIKKPVPRTFILDLYTMVKDEEGIAQVIGKEEEEV